MAFTGPPCATIVFFSSLIYRFDPLYFVLSDISKAFGVDKYGALASTWNFHSLAIRATCTFVTYETNRTTFLILFQIVIYTDLLQYSLKNVQKKLPKKENITKLVDTYVKLLLIYCIGATVLESCMSIVCSVLFWLLLLCGWLVLKGSQMIPVCVYGMIVALFLVGLPIVVYFFDSFACVCHLAEKLIIQMRIRSRYNYAGATPSIYRRKMLEVVKTITATRPLLIKYLPVRVNFDRNLKADCVKNFWGRFFDLILLF